MNRVVNASSPVGSPGPRFRQVSLLSLASLVALLTLAACGLIGGGVSADEHQLIVDELESTKKEAEGADSLASSERIKATNLQAEIETLKKQIADSATVKESGLISLERARLEVIRHAQQNLDVYSATYRSVPLVWEVFSAEEKDDFYYIKLTYRPFGSFTGQEGLEEFIMEKSGKIEFRQVLEEPDPEGNPREKSTETKEEEST